MIEKIKEFVENNPKLVTKKELSVPGLFILKYKKNVFWDNLWNDVLVETRGTVIDADYNVVSRPFTKIFNYMENGTTIPRDEFCIAYRKINGFMASITYYKGELLVTTTGTDDSEFADMAKQMIIDTVNLKALKNFCGAYNDISQFTLIVEICHPLDPHIVPEYAGVYLLGIRENKWESQQNVIIEHSHRGYVYWASELNMKHCERIDSRFSNIVRMAKKVNHEGFVVYGKDSKINLKIKSPYYLMSKFLARKNEEKLIKLIDSPQEIKKIVDEEYYDVVDYVCSVKEQFIKADEQGRLNIIRNFIEGKI